MSMQDNIFDVNAALVNKQERVLFAEIITYLGQLEAEVAVHRKLRAQLRDGFMALKCVLEDR